MARKNYILSLILLQLFIVCGMTDAKSQSQTDNVSEWQYTLPMEIYNSISKGDISNLSTYLNNTVEISMPQGEAHVFSRKQAEVVIADYFTTIRNAEFNIEHEKSMPPSTLTIGTIKGNGIEHRILILTQKHGNIRVIHQLRVEEKEQ